MNVKSLFEENNFTTEPSSPVRGAFSPYFEAGQNRVASAEAKSPALHNVTKKSESFRKNTKLAENKTRRKKKARTPKSNTLLGCIPKNKNQSISLSTQLMSYIPAPLPFMKEAAFSAPSAKTSRERAE